MVSVDLGPEGAPVAHALRELTLRLLTTAPDSRLACVNVLKTARIGLDYPRWQDAIEAKR